MAQDTSKDYHKNYWTKGPPQVMQGKKKDQFCKKETINQSPILVANIWPLPKHLPWVMTCPEHIQKLPVVNQPGIILNLIGSRETVSKCQSSLLREHFSAEYFQTKPINKNEAWMHDKASQHAKTRHVPISSSTRLHDTWSSLDGTLTHSAWSARLRYSGLALEPPA